MTQEIWTREHWKSRAICGRAILTMLVSRVAIKAPRQTASRMTRRFRAEVPESGPQQASVSYLTPSRAEVGEDFSEIGRQDSRE